MAGAVRRSRLANIVRAWQGLNRALAAKRGPLYDLCAMEVTRKPGLVLAGTREMLLPFTVVG